MSDSMKYGRGQVIDIIHSVIDKMGTGQDVSRDVFVHLAELAQIIDHLKKDISSARPEHVKNSHIPDATDELDEVINATADATHRIMSLCEEIETELAQVEGEAGQEIAAKVTQIYEACGFQDITGQRIRKVVSTLQVIEEKIDLIMGTLGNAVGLKMSDERLEKAVSVEDEQSLLNGPQSHDKAISQDEIDRLLAEFDNP